MPASYLRFRSNQDSLRIVAVDLNVSPATKLFIKTLRAVAKEGM
jgi:hypothetical protein